MIGNLKVKIFIPAGRRRFMKLLIPQLLRCKGIEYVDEIMILNNTDDPADKKYISSLKKIDKVKIYNPLINFGKLKNIYDFYKYLCDDDTIYIKMDDDIVFIDDNFLWTLINFRLVYTQYFMIFPSIVNNAFSNQVLQERGKVNNHISDVSLKDFGGTYFNGVEYDCLVDNSENGIKVHKEFLETYPNVDKYFFNERIEFDYQPMQINCVCFFGRIMNIILQYDAILNDEDDFTVRFTKKYNRVNCICGRALCCHYSFTEQDIDDKIILKQYKAIEKKRA